MDFQSVIFYFFSTVLVLASLAVITSKNPVHAALFLVLAFFTAGGIWMLLHAEFLAIALVMVYVGAVMVLGGRNFGLEEMPHPAEVQQGYSNTKELGRLLYTDYVYPFELASIVLLVAMVAAVALTLRKRKNVRKIDPAEQISVKRDDRVRIVSMRSEKD